MASGCWFVINSMGGIGLPRLFFASSKHVAKGSNHEVKTLAHEGGHELGVGLNATMHQQMHDCTCTCAC
eukprot:3054774-Karenia_brevis.AAC.1